MTQRKAIHHYFLLILQDHHANDAPNLSQYYNPKGGRVHSKNQSCTSRVSTVAQICIGEKTRINLEQILIRKLTELLP